MLSVWHTVCAQITGKDLLDGKCHKNRDQHLGRPPEELNVTVSDWQDHKCSLTNIYNFTFSGLQQTTYLFFAKINTQCFDLFGFLSQTMSTCYRRKQKNI